MPRVLVYDHKASGISREAIHASLVEGRDVWWQVRLVLAAREWLWGSSAPADWLACLRQGLAHAMPRCHAVLPTSSALACWHAHPTPHPFLFPPYAAQDVIGDQSTDCEVTWVGAEDPLFKLYTSGSTGKPKGVLHTTAGYMIGAAATFNYVFDYKPDDIYWCTADCGWITGERASVLLGAGRWGLSAWVVCGRLDYAPVLAGAAACVPTYLLTPPLPCPAPLNRAPAGHSYVTFGPLLMGAKQILFEGVPTYPDAGRCWEVRCCWCGWRGCLAIHTLSGCSSTHLPA